MEASPGSDNFCSTFFSSSPISHGGDGLSTICLLFIVYLPDIYEFTFYTFYCSNMLLSIAFFAWGRVIIYDDNLLRVHILHFLLLKHASLHRLFRMGESDYL
jgi:hypothetical protein